MRCHLVTVKILPATEDDARRIAENIREHDKQEIWASSMQQPFNAMKNGIKYSDQAMTGWANGEPVLMFGVVYESLVGNIGTPWMIASKQLDKYAITFLRRCKKPVLEMMQKYDTLINHVDARNVCAIRWLEWLGFHVEPQPKRYGALALPFHRFTMERS